MPDRPLFFYGTLCDPDLLALVLGRAIDRRNVLAALAPGYRAVYYNDRVYPALLPAPGGRAEGLLVLGFSRFERDVIDAYEGEEYRREVLPVIADGEVHEADAYLPNFLADTARRPWTLGGWQQNHKADVLVEEGQAARRLRERILAARPN